LLALIRTIRIIIGVVVGVAALNAICMGIYVRKRRQASVLQTACWTAVGLFFPLLSWFILCFCGSSLPASHKPSLAMVNLQGSAPPASDSVVMTPPAFNPAYSLQQQQQQLHYPQYPAQALPPQQLPPAYALSAQPPPGYAYPPQAATFYHTGSV
jgi:hypothetical protein